MDNLQLPQQSISEQPEPSNYSSKWLVDIFTGLGKVLNSVGIAGFLVIAFIIFVFVFADKSHKDEIIDCWLLFKGGNNQFVIVVFFLIMILFAQQIHYKRVIAMQETRINELANKKSSNYSKQLAVKLSTSQKNRKS